VGVADRMTEIGLPWRFGNSFYRGQRVFRMEAPHDPHDRFFPIINVQQPYMEEFLHDACQANPLIDFRWGNKLNHLSQKEGYALLEVDTCPLEGFAPAEYDRILGLENTPYQSCVVCACGYRSSDDKYASLAKVRYASSDLIEHR
jgi:hypothetical protein